MPNNVSSAPTHTRFTSGFTLKSMIAVGIAAPTEGRSTAMRALSASMRDSISLPPPGKSAGIACEPCSSAVTAGDTVKRSPSRSTSMSA